MVKPDNSVIQYRYNAEGLREVKVREDGSEVRYLLDGLVVLCEYDGNLNILKEYVPGISMKTNGNTYYYITDRLGSVRYVLDETGAIVNSYTYTPFGQIHNSSGSVNQPYRYVGGEFYWTEEDTGLKLLGQRWYDSETGRFISRDPIGEEVYRYSRNNPLNFIDPEGKQSAAVPGVGIGIGTCTILTLPAWISSPVGAVMIGVAIIGGLTYYIYRSCHNYEICYLVKEGNPVKGGTTFLFCWYWWRECEYACPSGLKVKGSVSCWPCLTAPHCPSTYLRRIY